jgi:hypothetical protein
VRFLHNRVPRRAGKVKWAAIAAVGLPCSSATLHTQHNIGDFAISVGTDHEILSLREAVLKQAGFHVFTVSDGKQALEESELLTVGCCCFVTRSIM